MIKDYVILGALVGIGADIVKLLVNYSAKLLDLTPVVFWQIVATRFLDKKDLFKPIAYLIGGIADITVSALMGIVFVYFIYFFGSKFIWIKGVGFGLAIWVAVFGTLLGQTVQTKLPQQPQGIVVTIVAHLFFGLAIGVLTGSLHLEKPKIKTKKPKVFHFIPEPVRKMKQVDDDKMLKKPIKITKMKRW